MSALTTPEPEQGKFRQNELKWTPTLMKTGWTVLPSIILESQQALGLDATDVNIILHLARHWWSSDNLPFPSKRTIAVCMGVHPSTVQRRIRAMEVAGLLERVERRNPTQGQQSNCYDLSGLIETATPLAKDALTKREKRRMEDAAKRAPQAKPGRTNPNLKVVSKQ